MSDLKLSFSALMQFAKSPNHYLAYKERAFVSSPSMDLGKLVHKFILEPQEMEHEVVQWTGGRRYGKKWDEFQEEHKDKMIVTQQEYSDAQVIANRVFENKFANEILMQLTTTEEHFDVKFNGHKLHGFRDGRGDDIAMDLKTTSDASKRGFMNSVTKFNYHVQGALYTLGMDVPYYIIAVETKPPYNVMVYRLSDEFIKAGREYLAYLLEKFEEWVSMGAEPIGYEFWSGEDYVELDTPDWLKKED